MSTHHPRMARMHAVRLAALAGVTVLAGGVLAACGQTRPARSPTSS